MNATNIKELASQINFVDLHELFLEKYKYEIERHVRNKRQYKQTAEDVINNIMEPIRRQIAMRVCEEMADYTEKRQ